MSELHCCLSDPFLTDSSTMQQRGLPCQILKSPPPYYITGVPRQRNMAQMTEQSKISERELRDEEIANISDGELKALVTKMLTELTELGQKMKKQMKDAQNEIKQNIQGTNSDRKETRTQINDLEQKEEINIDQNRMKTREFKKMRRGLGTSRTTLNIPASKS